MADDFDLTSYLPYLLNRAGTRIADSFSTRLRREHGISLQMWRVLAALHHRDRQRVSELADTTSIEISTLSRLITSIEKRGLVSRRRGLPGPEGADARVVLVALTPEGWRLTERIIPVALSYEAIALGNLAGDEAEQLRDLLRRVFQNLDDLDEAEYERLAS